MTLFRKGPIKIVLIRQRPAFGDALLLGPLIQAVRAKHINSHVTVVTDPNYMAGVLPLIFENIAGVDRVECITSMEWTTEGNKRIDPLLYAAGNDMPYTIRNADILLDCNSAFIDFEREYHGDTPYGITEFWPKYHGYYTSDLDLMPHFTVSEENRQSVLEWKETQRIKKPMVGIVLRAGDSVRDWDFNGLCGQLVDWLHTSGYAPVGIDPIKTLPSIYGHSCIGKRLDYVAALLEQCKLVITPDTGLLHLAQAVETRTVALWGIMRPELRVKGYNCRVVPEKSLGYCADEDQRCNRCWKFQRWSCLKRLTLPMVLAGLQESL